MTPRNWLRAPSLISSTAVGSHTGFALETGSEIVPGWAFPIAAALVNVTWPNRVNGTGVQRPFPAHVDGASAIHSAEETSRGWVSVMDLREAGVPGEVLEAHRDRLPLDEHRRVHPVARAHDELDRHRGCRHDLPPGARGRASCSCRRTRGSCRAARARATSSALPPSPTQNAAESRPAGGAGRLRLDPGRGDVAEACGRAVRRGCDVAGPVRADLRSRCQGGARAREEAQCSDHRGRSSPHGRKLVRGAPEEGPKNGLAGRPGYARAHDCDRPRDP